MLAISFIPTLIKIAREQVGVREEPSGSNNGPQIREYLKSVNLGGGHPWCAAFVRWCFVEAQLVVSRDHLGEIIPNPCPRTASALRMFSKAPVQCQIPANQKIGEDGHFGYAPEWISIGSVFVKATGKYKGHCGIVTSVVDVTGWFETIEGNTNRAGHRNGDGVYVRRRNLREINKGFVDYTRGGF